MAYFGGIEGGASHTKMVLMNEKGEVLSETVGESTNHWLIGLEECFRRINDLVVEAKRKANIDVSLPLKSIGMSLSGADSEEACRDITSGIAAKYPGLSDSYLVRCDTLGSVATGCENGGMVLISGTGSNCEVVNPDGRSHRCGGWGHMMGDEGSAFWITRYCVKKMFDTTDNLEVCPHELTVVKDVMTAHFGSCSQMDMLGPLYTNFDKSFFAGMCEKLSKGATEQNDPLCKEAFYEAGRLLGRHVLALTPKIDQSLLTCQGGLHIVCVGSVWKSWQLMKEGFLHGITSNERMKTSISVPEVTLVRLTKPCSYGAAYLGAKHVGHDMHVDFSQNASVFFNQKL